MKNKKYWLIGLAVILIAPGIFIIYKVRAQSATGKYTTSQVQKGTIVSSVSASGSVVSSNFYSVETQASGMVQTVYVKDGDKVYTGQKLLTLTLDQAGEQASAEAYAAYLKAKSSLQTAEDSKLSLASGVDQSKSTLTKNLKQAKLAVTQAETDVKNASSSTLDQKKLALSVAKDALDLAQSQFDSQNDVTIAQDKFNDADNGIRQAQINLQAAWLAYQQTQSVVTAPISGTINGMSCYGGMTIASNSSSSSSNSNTKTNTQLLAISNQANPIISVSVSESDISKIKSDQKATITVDALADKTFTGKVIGINKTGVVSSNVTNYPVTIQFDDQANDVLPNMSATANIILESKTDVLTVPSSALTLTNNQYTVQILVNGAPQTKNVEVGISSDTDTEITSGLSGGENVITSTVSTATTSSSGSTSSIFGGIRTGGGGSSLGSSGNTRTRTTTGGGFGG